MGNDQQPPQRKIAENGCVLMRFRRFLCTLKLDHLIRLEQPTGFASEEFVLDLSDFARGLGF
jgi:hypothetical protein